MGFGVLLAVKNYVVVIQVIISCGLSGKYQHFRVTCCLSLQKQMLLHRKSSWYPMAKRLCGPQCQWGHGSEETLSLVIPFVPKFLYLLSMAGS